jgi:uncharacterized repeat protein (TIGR01451 family)
VNRSLVAGALTVAVVTIALAGTSPTQAVARFDEPAPHGTVAQLTGPFTSEIVHPFGVAAAPCPPGPVVKLTSPRGRASSPGPSHDTAAAAATCADLSAVGVPPAAVIPDERTVTLTLRVTSAADAPDVEATLTDELSLGIVSTSWRTATSSGTCTSSTASTPPFLTTVTCPLGGIPAGTTATATIVAEAFEPGQSQSCAAIASPEDQTSSNNRSCTGITVVPSADVELGGAVAPSSVGFGDRITYTLTATNNGVDDAVSPPVTIEDVLPAASTLVAVVASDGVTCNNGPTTVLCTVGLLAPQPVPDLSTRAAAAPVTSATVSITVSAGCPGPLINNARIFDDGVFDPVAANNGQTASTPVDCPANLRVSNTPSPEPVSAGDDVTYSIDVTNDGPGVADAVTLTNPLPPTMTLVSASSTRGPCSGTTTVSCDLGTLAVGDQVGVTITARTSTLGAFTDTATAATSSEEANPADNSASATSTVVGSDLAVTNTDAPDPVVAGDKIGYTITVSNTGPGSARNVTMTDPLPGTTTLVSASPGCSGTSTVTCAIGTLAPGQQEQRTIVVFTSQLGPLTDTASVSTTTIDPNPANNDATATSTIVGADLAVTNVATPEPVSAGDEVTYTISVTNGGQGKASDVTLTDPLPTGLTLVSATSTRGTCTGSGTLTCPLGSLLTGEQAFVTIVARTSAPGSVANTAVAATSTIDPNQSDNSATATATVTGADLRVTKTVAPDAVPLGGTVTYTIHVENTGAATARNVVIVDDLPNGLTLTGLRASQGSCTGTRTITCSLGDLPAGGKAALALTATTTKTGSIVNTVTATTSTPETAPATHTATADVAVTTADLDVTGQANPESVTPGTPVTFSFDVTNNGPGLADATTLTADLPAGAAGFEVHTTQGTCSVVGRLQCQLGSLAPGDHVTVALSMTPLTTGISIVSAEVASNQVDPITRNDSVVVRATAAAVHPVPNRVPKLAVSPQLAPAGFVARASGRDFPPGATIVLRWRPGIGRAVVVADASGRFTTSMLVFHHDQLGPRQLVATPAHSGAFDATQAPFLVVLGTAEPPQFNSRP